VVAGCCRRRRIREGFYLLSQKAAGRIAIILVNAVGEADDVLLVEAVDIKKAHSDEEGSMRGSGEDMQ
jgi:hypothetical protein